MGGKKQKARELYSLPDRYSRRPLLGHFVILVNQVYFIHKWKISTTEAQVSFMMSVVLTLSILFFKRDLRVLWDHEDKLARQEKG